MMTFPQVIIDEKLIGGYQELVKADRDGVLDDLVEAEAAAAKPGRAPRRGWQLSQT